MISKIMDLLEKIANHNKKQEEQAMAGYLPIQALTNSTPNGTYTTTATIYPTANTGGLGGVMGTLGSGSAGASTTYLQAMAQNQQVNAYNNAYGVAYALPPMIGVMHTITFVDARGIQWALEVDAAYAQIMQDISNNHNHANQIYNYPNQPQIMPQAHMKMLEGDFSEEEMTEAEGIIAELEGAHGEAPRP